MNDKTQPPGKQPEPVLDTSSDSDEAAFEWMKPQAQGPATSGPAVNPATSSGPAASPAPTRAERKASEAAVADQDTAPDPAGKSPAGAHFSEPLPTSMLQVRPPEEEVERRNAERENAANSKPVLPRVMQVLLAVFFPVILLVLAVRVVATPLFLWVEYYRPGFPGDGYGFNTDDRITYGSYVVDYLSNWAGPRYLGDLVGRSGDSLFQPEEVSHMADVKLVFLSALAGGFLLIVLSIVAMAYLKRRSTGGIRRGLFAGSIVTLVLILGLGTLAVLGWQQFFTDFHRLFFASGTWTFALEDTLIRLFPGQFWVDAGIVIGALVLLAGVVTLVLTWPTRRRRGLPPRQGRAARKAAEGKATEGKAAESGVPTESAGTATTP
ncbi:TIGR01906 family membrane protein [Pseudarthrobacter sp. J75]|uniref:TIGR01906 family membrane protein n=1 Tax=unclassified Pseudarthrobacter TaxID=2647000 RepID=UPI002E7FEB92|nr:MULTISPECIES: TIGR01906 family membrane protein [unclassified Pseudarthrobacter]MEE2521643.1 TIGR01906 family membrane protein [Pseudarthrobacter sp. J47]MEE2527720.1 TIGR01906 family membrane protein [Pseudarthrobacter sp. J75]